MNVKLIETLPLEDAIWRLRDAGLDAAGNQCIPVYHNAIIRLGDYMAYELNPTSLYVLRKNYEIQRDLRAILLDTYGIDTLRLDCVLKLESDGKIIGMAPPFVEVYEERVRILPKEGDREPPQELWLRIPMLKDGIHRGWLARQLGVPLRCVVASDTPREHAPYIYPNEWSQVAVYDTVPSVKKFYRRQNPYTFMRPLQVLRQVDDKAPQVQWGR